MKKLTLFALAVATAISTGVNAEGADDDLINRNRALQEMSFIRDKLALQADMSKSLKDMADSGFFVDPKGVPLGVGDMEVLAMQVRNRIGLNPATQEYNPSDPFAGVDPVIPMPNSGFFGGPSFPEPPAPPPAPAAPVEVEKVEVVSKPTEREKAQGKEVLRLVELRNDSAVFFTNDGFKEVRTGEQIYDQKLVKVGVDNVSLRGKDGTRLVRIDWTKSVRYADD